MRIYKKFLLLFFSLFFLSALLFAAVHNIQASNKSSLPSITVINLIRSKELGHEKDNLFESLKAQWQVTADEKVNATWLLQYSVLEDKQMTDFAKNQMKNQEFGLLFEIDRNFATKSGVSYRGQGPSYFSDGLLLVSYDREERKKLIDNAFKKFKNVFGYYPKTVGAWYIGSDSLDYMQQKYGIVAALKASDQFNLDVYTIWGAPWSIPYLSSVNNQLIPANSYDESSKVVNLQWAARDPNKGYKDPLFSIQDFGIKGYDTNYVEYLANIFLKTKNDNLVFGLENGGDLNVFQKYYKSMLLKASELEKDNKVKIIDAKDFADQFLQSKKTIAGTNYLLSKDYKSNDQSFWYSTPSYRVYIQKNNDVIFLSDIRDYSKKEDEDYFLLNNSQGQIRVASPEILDTISFPDKRVSLLKTNDPLQTEIKDNKIFLKSGKSIIGIFTKDNFNLSENGRNLTYDFSKKQTNTNITLVLMTILIGYFIFSLHRFNKIFISISVFIPFILSLPFLSNGPSLIFDKKELIVLNVFANPVLFSNVNLIFLFQILPFILLVTINLLFLLKNTKLWKYIYFLLLLLAVLLYSHIFYFPLDKQVIKLLLILSPLMVFLMGLIGISIFKFTHSKSKFISFILICLAILSYTFVSIIFSRSKVILTDFENQAMQIVKTKKEEVILVSQVDYNVKPIYKAIKPFLYENTALAQKLTGTKWTTILRPQDNVLKLTDYKNKLIFIPRYLGSDLSVYEQSSLKLTKIFDNYQIAIYEKK